MKSFSISPLSLEASRRRPGQKMLCSTASPWKSLLVQTYRQPSFVERYETLASPDYLFVLVQRGHYQIESLSAGRWKKASYRPGVAGVTAPWTVNHLRWHSVPESGSEVIRSYVPAAFFEEATEEFRKAGTRQKNICHDALAFSDPQLTATMHALSRAVATGVPDLYAESAARYLATHLVAQGHGWKDASAAWGHGEDLTDARLQRALDYMAWHFADQLTVEVLAKEAGISRFHFCRLFKAKAGISPHQHLARLRIRHAELLLRTSALSIGEIVAECGYVHAGHFAAAFSRAHGKTPTEYRRAFGRQSR